MAGYGIGGGFVTRPTHRHVPTGAVVYPEGYKPADLVALTQTELDAMDKAQAEKDALAEVDLARDGQRRMVMTQGPRGQGYVYSQKQREVDLWNALGNLGATNAVLYAAFQLLSATEQARRFPFLTAEATYAGETPLVVIQRWITAINDFRTKLGQIDAIAVKAKRDIRAAGSTALKESKADAAVTAMSSIS